MVNFVAVVIALLMEIGRRKFKRSKKKKGSSSEKVSFVMLLICYGDLLKGAGSLSLLMDFNIYANELQVSSSA